MAKQPSLPSPRLTQVEAESIAFAAARAAGNRSDFQVADFITSALTNAMTPTDKRNTPTM